MKTSLMILAVALSMGMALAMAGNSRVEAKGMVRAVCSIPTPGYGTGYAMDVDARLSANQKGTSLSCSAAIPEPRPSETIVFTGASTGLPCVANGLETLDWEAKLSKTARVAMKCVFSDP
jgi:hypothetical protein